MSISFRKVFMAQLLSGVGGPASFQKKLISSLESNGIKVCISPIHFNDCQSILVINATRKIHILLLAKIRGKRIVQRLGSPFPSNSNQNISAFQRLRTWAGMLNVAFIRRYLADRIVYQSLFVKKCWDEKYGSLHKPYAVVYNGVDLSLFSEHGPKYESSSDICIISVEGTQNYPEHSPAFLVSQELKKRGVDVELLVFGKPWSDTAEKYAIHPHVVFMGPVANNKLPFFYRGASVYLLNDIVNAGCPNSVIEALACGTPVVGYSPGVLSEMLTPNAGICVPANGDPWKGEQPGNIELLSDAVLKIANNNIEFRKGARQLAEKRYDLTEMVDNYENFFFIK